MITRLQSICSAIVAPDGAPAPRPVGSIAHARVREYLKTRLRDLGAEPAFGADVGVPYVRDGLHFENLVGRIGGSRLGKQPFLLGAHYDTVHGSPGADDNAAAIAIVLELAQNLKSELIDREVLICFFDAEEPDNFLTDRMGSRRLFEDKLAKSEIPLPFIFDLCGHDFVLPGLEAAIAVVGLESASELRSAFERCSASERLVPIPVPNAVLGGNFSDYDAFERNGYPYLFFSCGEWEHYHAPTDVPAVLNFAKMAAIVQYVEMLLRKLDASTDDVRRSAPLSSRDDWFTSRLRPLLAGAGFDDPDPIGFLGDLRSRLYR